MTGFHIKGSRATGTRAGGRDGRRLRCLRLDAKAASHVSPPHKYRCIEGKRSIACVDIAGRPLHSVVEFGRRVAARTARFRFGSRTPPDCDHVCGRSTPSKRSPEERGENADAIASGADERGTAEQGVTGPSPETNFKKDRCAGCRNTVFDCFVLFAESPTAPAGPVRLHQSPSQRRKFGAVASPEVASFATGRFAAPAAGSHIARPGTKRRRR